MRTTLCLLIVVFGATTLRSQNCSRTSTGHASITDLLKNNDYSAGLYPGGNYDYGIHEEEGYQRAARIVPLDGNGVVDSTNGKIVMIAFGMRERMAEAAEFKKMIDTFGQRNEWLQFVDCSQPGMDVEQFLTSGQAWNNIVASLTAAGATPKQVQTMWFEDFLLRQSDSLSYHYADTLKNYYVQVFQKLHQLFPNLKSCYLTGSAYAGYATNSSVIREPFAYQTGWAVKWVIQDQINCDPSLQYTVTGAPPPQVEKAPWLAWGPYFWADGTRVWMDTTLRWHCPTDFDTDGTTLAGAGVVKAASMLFHFFSQNRSPMAWFTNNNVWHRNLIQVLAPRLYDTVYTQKIHFQWNRVPGASQYFVSTDGANYKGPDTSADIIGYKPGLTRWSVAALDDTGYAFAGSQFGTVAYFPSGYPINLVTPANGATHVAEPVQMEWNILQYHEPWRKGDDYAILFFSSDSLQAVQNSWFIDGYDYYNTNTVSLHLKPSTTYYWWAASYFYNVLTPLWKFTTSAEDKPFIYEPRNRDDSVPVPVRLCWEITGEPNAGRFELATDPALTNIVAIDSGNCKYLKLDTFRTYYWRVVNTVTGETTDTESFTTGHTRDTTLHFSAVRQGEVSSTERARGNIPNPFSRFTTLFLTLEKGGPVELRVFDVAGREVMRRDEDILSAGEHHVAFDRGNLPAGVYFYRLITGSSTQSGSMIVQD